MGRGPTGGGVFLKRVRTPDRAADSSSLHPSELEFAHYLRGTLEPGHAATLFAHTLLCHRCREQLESQLADGPWTALPRRPQRPEEPGR